MLRPVMRIADPRRRLRQLRWFEEAFRTVAAEMERETGTRFRIDAAALATAFFNWLDALAAVPPPGDADHVDAVVFAAGLALRELVALRPAVAAGKSGSDSLLYARFCMAAVAAVDLDSHGQARPLDPCAQEPRFWASYSENVAFSPDAAIAFFERLHGIAPNWEMPLAAVHRPAGRITAPAGTGLLTAAS